jgi:hypothetical protein
MRHKKKLEAKKVFKLEGILKGRDILEFSKNSLRKSWSIGTKVAFQYSSLVISRS